MIVWGYKMKHIILLLYFLSYTSGIGAMTLAGFYYMKVKIDPIKLIIFGDLFFTLSLFFDTLNYYTDIFMQGFPVWLQLLKMLGLIISNMGMIYFFTIYVCAVTDIKVTRRMKMMYFFVSFTLMILGLSILFFLYNRNVITRYTAIQTGFFLSNIFTAVGSICIIILIIKKWHKIGQTLKKFCIIVVLIISILTPVSVLTNLIQYKFHINFPVAFSPIGYFSLNLTGIIFASKNFRINTLAELTTKDSIISKATDYSKFISEFSLTSREVEIIKLVIEGLSNQEIGKKLFISSNTVRNHIYSIYKKMDIKSRYELISLVSKK